MFLTPNEPKHAERLPRAARTYGLNMNERNWCAHYALLQSIGYHLRRRFEPDWVPSWINDEKKSELLCEDGQPLRVCRFIICTCLSVVLTPCSTLMSRMQFAAKMVQMSPSSLSGLLIIRMRQRLAHTCLLNHLHPIHAIIASRYMM